MTSNFSFGTLSTTTRNVMPTNTRDIGTLARGLIYDNEIIHSHVKFFFFLAPKVGDT